MIVNIFNTCSASFTESHLHIGTLNIIEILVHLDQKQFQVFTNRGFQFEEYVIFMNLISKVYWGFLLVLLYVGLLNYSFWVTCRYLICVVLFVGKLSSVQTHHQFRVNLKLTCN